MIETEINKEIREYKETLAIGLTLRQLFFSLLGCIISVGIYFLLRGKLGTEAVSWACIFGMLPCAVAGFARYNGMPAEKFIAAFIRSKLLMPKRLTFKPYNLLEELKKEEDNAENKKKGTGFGKNTKKRAGHDTCDQSF